MIKLTKLSTGCQMGNFLGVKRLLREREREAVCGEALKRSVTSSKVSRAQRLRIDRARVTAACTTEKSDARTSGRSPTTSQRKEVTIRRTTGYGRKTFARPGDIVFVMVREIIVLLCGKAKR